MGWSTSEGTTKMSRRLLPTVLLAVLAGAACEQPTAPAADPLDDAAVASLAQQVSDATDVHLPSLGGLLRASRDAIHEQDGNAEAVKHFRRARRLNVAAEDSLAAGNKDAARRLARAAYHQTLAGIVTALGTDAVSQAVAGASAGLGRVDARLEGREVSERVTQAVERIREHVSAASTALSGGEPVRALAHALAAADGIRHLSPRYVAHRMITRAARLFKAARAAVGSTPTDEEISALRRAHRLLGAARDELDAGRFLRAAEAGRRSARLSWGVLQGRIDAAGG